MQESEDGSHLFNHSQMHHNGVPIKQRHSVHSTALSGHLLPLNSQITQQQKIDRSPSADCGKPDDSGGHSNNGGNRFMKWLGFSSSSTTTTNGVRKQQRRMSTY